MPHTGKRGYAWFIEELNGIIGFVKAVEARAKVGTTIGEAAAHLQFINSSGGADTMRLMRAWFKDQITYLTYSDFRLRWKYLRPMISLQGRLLCEQIFYEIGSPYDALITGFGVIEEGGLVYPDEPAPLPPVPPPWQPPEDGGGGPSPPVVVRTRKRYY